MHDPPLPERCTAQQIADVLAATAQPRSRVLLDQPLSDPEGPLWLVTDRLWSVELWRTAEGHLDRTLSARSPDGATWQRGCQRHWTTSGEVIEPLQLLTAEQLEALEVRLQEAALLPEPEGPGASALVFCDRLRPKQRLRRRSA